RVHRCGWLPAQPAIRCDRALRPQLAAVHPSPLIEPLSPRRFGLHGPVQYATRSGVSVPLPSSLRVLDGVPLERSTHRVFRRQIPAAILDAAVLDRVLNDSRSAVVPCEAVPPPSASKSHLSYARSFRLHVFRPADLRAAMTAPEVHGRAHARVSLHYAVRAPVLRRFALVRATHA